MIHATTLEVYKFKRTPSSVLRLRRLRYDKSCNLLLLLLLLLCLHEDRNRVVAIQGSGTSASRASV